MLLLKSILFYRQINMQKDLKFINAYSSVSHVGLILFALLMMNKIAMDGAIL